MPMAYGPSPWGRLSRRFTITTSQSMAFASSILRYSSILDRVKDRAESLARQVSSTDKLKLDEYLTSVREVERRIERMRALKDQAEGQAKLRNRHVFTMERPQNG